MPITVSDIEQKEFHFKLFKGYDPEEVDRYLDDICDQMYILYQHIDTLQQRLAQANQAPAYAPRSAVPPPAAAVDFSAQAQDELNQARQKARGIIEEAQEDARQIRAEAEALLEEARNAKQDAQPAQAAVSMENLEEQKTALQEEIEMLKATARDYRLRFQRLVEDQQHVLNAETELFE